MQLLVILLVAIVLGHEGLGADVAAFERLPWWAPWLAAWGPALFLVIAQEAAVRWCVHRLQQGTGHRAVVATDRWLRRTPWMALVALAVAVYVFGWLDAVRRLTGRAILLDEVMAILPVLVVVAAAWWSWHPIERRLREASLVRRLDLGLPIVAMPGRTAYVVQQVRIHLLLLLVPILLAVGLGESAGLLLARWVPDRPYWADGAVSFAGIAVVFVFAPGLIRLLLDVRPLPPGAIREDLEKVCAAHRVRMAELLLWNTGGSVINAAVIGLVRLLRYVLLSDALLDSMNQDQLRAVMAHEVGHVRLRHMIWLGLSLVAAIAGAAIVVDSAIWFAAGGRSAEGAMVLPTWVDAVSVPVSAVLALTVFGFVSRRFERQADAFAVAHLSRGGEAGTEGEAAPRVTPTAVESMCSALEAVARLNNVDPNRRSWRHGSIRWRQQALVAILDCPLARLPIDRQVRMINAASAAIVVLVAAATVLGTLAD